MGKQRGCGTRSEGGLYACCELAEGGRPIEDFVVDPAIPWPFGPFQGIQLRERQDDSGVYDLIDWVGRSFYPTVPDFVEEGRVMGFSTKIPVNSTMDYSLLTPYESTIIYVHANAIPQFEYQLHGFTPGHAPTPSDQMKSSCEHRRIYSLRPSGPPCTFACWDLSMLIEDDRHRVSLGDDCATIKTPSVIYTVSEPISRGEGIYVPGVFLRVPLTRFEFIGDALTEDVAGVLGDHAETNVLLCED